MFYIPDLQIDQLLSDDIQHGDLTTRALGISRRRGKMTFIRRESGCVSGIAIAERLLKKLSLEVDILIHDGEQAVDAQSLLVARGSADALHQGWKVVQNVLEWSCGVSQYMAEMVRMAQQVNPEVHIACTRKSIPGTKFLAIPAIVAGGGIVHRAGTAETILLFANHRRFCDQPDDWQQQLSLLRQQAPEKKIIVEADNLDEALAALRAQPDVLQLDKFTPEQICQLLITAQKLAPHCLLSATGGIAMHNVQKFAATGVRLLVTSAPYYAEPADIKVVLQPD